MIGQILLASMFWQAPPPTDVNAGTVIYLYEKGQCDGTRCLPDKLLGNWNLRDRRYYRLVGKEWVPDICPTDLPKEAQEAAKKEIPTGVDKNKLKDAPAYSNRNRVITAEDAYKAVLLDDSTKPRLTIIGTPAQQEAAIASLPAGIEEKYLIWVAEPTHWSVRNFHAAGAPTIVVQEPSGHILARAESIPKDFSKFLSGGPDAEVPISWIAIVLGAIMLLFGRKQ